VFPVIFKNISVTDKPAYAVKKYSDTFPVIKYLNIYHFVFPSIVPTAHGEVYSIQHYVMKFVRLAAGRCFSPATLVLEIVFTM
jgi:hypothetical protein